LLEGVCDVVGVLVSFCAAALGIAAARRNKTDDIDAANFIVSLVLREGDVLEFTF
jgi:hypothetical protein